MKSWNQIFKNENPIFKTENPIFKTENPIFKNENGVFIFENRKFGISKCLYIEIFYAIFKVSCLDNNLLNLLTL